MAEFGNNFRQAREDKGLSIEEIAAETRISSRFLKAIEDEDFSSLPGGIVGRGFVRTYATSVGLDADQAVAGYESLSQYREPPLAQGFRISSTTSAKTNRNFYPLAAGLLVLLVIGFYVFTRESPTVVTTAPIQPAATVPAAPTPQPPPAPTSNPAPTTAEAAAPPDTTTPPQTAPPPATTRTYLLEIEATDDAWINVTSDGTMVAQRILHKGETRRFTADNSLVLVTGNAGGLQIKVNGREQPPLGDNGRVRTLNINPATIKELVP